MTETVYILLKSVNYEGNEICGVYATEKAVRDAIRKEAHDKWGDKEWREWESDDPHVLSITRHDTTFVGVKYEVLE